MAILNSPEMFDQIRRILTSPYDRTRLPSVRQGARRDDEVPDQQIEFTEYRRFDTPFGINQEDLATAMEGLGVSATDFAERLRELRNVGFSVQDVTALSFESRFPDHNPSCTGCRYWKGDLYLPCAVNPMGVEGDECSDFEAR